MSRQTDIVVTTIWEPKWLRGYLDNLRTHGRDVSTTIRIICDHKTPASVHEEARAAVQAGFKVDCPSLEEQVDYLKRLGLPDSFIPWNTDNRRNIGFLRAWESGADTVISIDDDNYCAADSDFVDQHHAVGAAAAARASKMAIGAPWFNICALLESDTRAAIYPRGFPYAARAPEQVAALRNLTADVGARRVAVNAGLWTDDPDVDAITRLALRPRVSATSADSVILDPGTWSPINTQNTALLREALPAYYYVRMGFPLQGMKVDRFGDILSGYFVQKCVNHRGDVVRIGSPVARHVRTPHNLLADLYHELSGIVITEELVPWLRELRLSGAGYAEAYASLAASLAAQAGGFKGIVWDQGGRDFLRETAACMQAWLDVLRRLG